MRNIDLHIKRVEDERELSLLREFMLTQPQFYPRFSEWVDGKCIPRIERGMYDNIIVMSDGAVIGDSISREGSDGVIEVKNFRIDSEYRWMDVGHFLMRQLKLHSRMIRTDVSIDNFCFVA